MDRASWEGPIQFHPSPAYSGVQFLKRAIGFVGQVHDHPHYQINFVENGLMSVGHSGRQFPLGRGQLCIIPPYQLHYQQTESGYEQLRININLNEQASCEMTDLLSAHITEFTLLSQPRSLDLLSILKQESVGSTRLSKMRTSNVLDHILLSCLESVMQRSENELRNRLIQLLQRNLGQKLLVKHICAELGMSQTQLERFVSQQFGCGVIELHNTMRLNEACQLLAGHKEMSLEHIADRLGFYDLAHFSRYFKRKLKMTPYQYRNVSHQQG